MGSPIQIRLFELGAARRAYLNLVDDSVQSRRVAVTLLYLADRGDMPAAREPALAPWPR